MSRRLKFLELSQHFIWFIIPRLLHRRLAVWVITVGRHNNIRLFADKKRRLGQATWNSDLNVKLPAMVLGAPLDTRQPFQAIWKTRSCDHKDRGCLFVLRGNPALILIQGGRGAIEPDRDCSPRWSSKSDFANGLLTTTISANMEKTFSMYRCILMDHRHRLMRENLCYPLFCKQWVDLWVISHEERSKPPRYISRVLISTFEWCQCRVKLHN